MVDHMPESGQQLALSLHRATALVDRVADSYLRPAHGIGLATFAALLTIDAVGRGRQANAERHLAAPAVTR